MNEQMERSVQERSTLKVTEFVTVSELATMMDGAPTEVITACMNLGDVDFLLGKTLAFVLAARNESGNVHRTEDLRPGEGHGFGTEDVVLGRFGLGLLGLASGRGAA